MFPKSPDDPITKEPLELVWCLTSSLLKMTYSYDLGEMYGDNHRCRSGLSQSMVQHLTQKVFELERFVDLKPGDTVLDIGSNDCTSLRACSTEGITRIGIAPTGEKSRQYYPDDVKPVLDFFRPPASTRCPASP